VFRWAAKLGRPTVRGCSSDCQGHWDGGSLPVPVSWPAVNAHGLQLGCIAARAAYELLTDQELVLRVDITPEFASAELLSGRHCARVRLATHAQCRPGDCPCPVARVAPRPVSMLPWSSRSRYLVRSARTPAQSSVRRRSPALSANRWRNVETYLGSSATLWPPCDSQCHVGDAAHSEGATG
jgi:hypothetical protein